MALVHVIASGKSTRLTELAAAAAHARRQGIDVDLSVTLGEGHAAELVARAAREGALRVVAAGGDGTIHEVVGALRGRELPLGVVPCGTANDFVRGHGIPDDLDEALAIAITAPPRPIDLGMLGDRPFANMATFGFAAELSADTDPELKRVLGPLAYGAHAVARAGELAPFGVRIEAADGFAWEGPALLVSVGNGRQAGDGKVLHPDALVDDGLLDLLVVPEVQATTVAGMLVSAVVNGGLGHEASLVRHRATRFQLATDVEVRVTCDGEPLTGEAFDVSLAAAALGLAAPDDSPMLRG